jgi:hypothetical protein
MIDENIIRYLIILIIKIILNIKMNTSKQFLNTRGPIRNIALRTDLKSLLGICQGSKKHSDICNDNEFCSLKNLLFRARKI